MSGASRENLEASNQQAVTQPGKNKCDGEESGSLNALAVAASAGEWRERPR